MDGSSIGAPFAKIGARAKVAVVPRIQGGRPLRLDVREDARGEFYELLVMPHICVRAVDVRPDMRHLLLLSHNQESGAKDKFLCGHDEREWFVAGVPETRGVRDVPSAMEALKPASVRALQDRLQIRNGDRLKRRTQAYVRQGEWFFIPAPQFAPDKLRIRRDEPLSRGTGSKPHMAQFAARSGGSQVYVSTAYPRGITEREYRELIWREPARAKDVWRVMMRNPDVYVRGRVSHPDHATIILDVWHMVHMNEEWRAPAMKHVAFLD